MNKIDLNRAKRLTAILAGREKAPSRYEEKKAKIHKEMSLKDMKKAIMKDARLLIRDSNPDDPFAREIYLFAFKGKFHQIEAGTHKIITEAEAKTLIEKIPETELFYVCTNSGMCPLPDAFVGQDSQAIQVKDEQAVIAFIKQKTGVEIKKTDL